MFLKKYIGVHKKYGAVTAIIAVLCMSAIAPSGIAKLLDTDPIPPHLKLKADKSHIVGTFRKSNGEIKYAYRTDQRVSNTPTSEVIKQGQKHGLQVQEEDIARRTKHSRTFNTSEPTKFVTEIISGEPQYYQDTNGEWYQAEYATTTDEAFDIQTRPNLISRIFLSSALAATTTSTFYPDADTESTSVDGFTRRSNASGESWSTLRSGSGNLSNDSEVNAAAGLADAHATTNMWISISRFFLLFDTSAIPDTDSIYSATISLQFNDISSDDANLSFNMSTGTPSSNIAISSSDYDLANFGSTDLSSDVDQTSLSTSVYNDWALNASGLAVIDKAGVSKFAFRSTADIDNVAPTWVSGAESRPILQTADTSGTSEDPKLVVVHVTDPDAPVIPTLKARKSTNETWASTTLQFDDALALGLEANKTYEVRGVIYASSTSATPDIKFRFGVVAGAEVEMGYVTATDDELLTGVGTTTTSGTINLTANNPVAILFAGTVKTSGSSGPFRLQWAQANSSGVQTGVGKGSYIYAQEL